MQVGLVTMRQCTASCGTSAAAATACRAADPSESRSSPCTGSLLPKKVTETHNLFRFSRPWYCLWNRWCVRGSFEKFLSRVLFAHFLFTGGVPHPGVHVWSTYWSTNVHNWGCFVLSVSNWSVMKCSVVILLRDCALCVCVCVCVCASLHSWHWSRRPVVSTRAILRVRIAHSILKRLSNDNKQTRFDLCCVYCDVLVRSGKIVFLHAARKIYTVQPGFSLAIKWQFMWGESHQSSRPAVGLLQ